MYVLFLLYFINLSSYGVADLIELCGPNEIYSNCSKPCPTTCENAPCDVPGNNCVIGCECKPNFARSGKNCVPEDQCSTLAKCWPNSHYTSCGSWCEKTCNNMYLKQTACIMSCKPGCSCNLGFVYDESKMACVLPKDCPENPPPKCYENEEFFSIGKTLGECNCSKCYVKKGPGCFCKEGYVRDKHGICVEAMSCFLDKICKLFDPFSEFSQCVNPCPPPYMCLVACMKGCLCMPGYTSVNNRCVPIRPQI